MKKIVVCGNSGVGKTALCENLSKSLSGARLLPQMVYNNRYSWVFYKNWMENGDGVYNHGTYPMLMNFMDVRMTQEGTCNEEGPRYIIDRSLLEDRHVFGEFYLNHNFMNLAEAKQYHLMFNKLYRRIRSPEIFVY
jgi:deoxyadenosine/deoxycytidine kinase